MRPRASTLFLRLREPASAWAATLALGVYYAATMARDLSLYDSGELALAAVQLGLGHPPGQPLHTLIGHLLSLLPVPKLVGVGLASVLPAALTVIPTTSLAQSLCPSDTPRFPLRALPWLIALGALHVAFWEPATRGEVYVRASVVAVWAVARLSVSRAEGHVRTPRDVFLAGLMLGASASVNPIIAMAAAFGVAPGILRDVARRQLSWKALPAAVGGGLLGLLPYAYVLVVAHRRDVMVWGAPRDAASLTHYFLLADYLEAQTASFGTLAAHMLSWVTFGAEKALWPMCALGLVGHVWLRRHTYLGGAAAALLFFGVLVRVAYNTTWNLEVPDYLGYVVSALWVLLAGAAALCVQAYCNGEKRSAAFLAGCVVLCSIAAQPHVLSRTRVHDRFCRDMAQQALREAPKNAIVIAERDHIAGALMYLQEAEHVRPDVVVLMYGLGSSSWHWEMVYRQHPELSPMALQGPGGKPGRLRRFLALHPQRPVLVERAHIAAAVGLRTCATGLYLRTGELCSAPRPVDPSVAALLRRSLDTLDAGAGGVDQAIAATAYDVGVAFFRAGHGKAAYDALLAGVPRSMIPPSLAKTPSAVERAPALRAPLPEFGRGAALGDPARNLFVAAMLLSFVNENALARDALDAAADDGLPEAIVLQSRM